VHRHREAQGPAGEPDGQAEVAGGAHGQLEAGEERPASGAASASGSPGRVVEPGCGGQAALGLAENGIKPAAGLDRAGHGQGVVAFEEELARHIAAEDAAEFAGEARRGREGRFDPPFAGRQLGKQPGQQRGQPGKPRGRGVHVGEREGQGGGQRGCGQPPGFGQ
jgi:hypothetical protein